MAPFGCLFHLEETMLMHKTIVICDSCDEKAVIDYAGSKV